MSARKGCVALATVAVANLLVFPASAQSSATYTYDANGRLVTVTSGNTTTTYTYDQAGNRTRVVTNINHTPTAGAANITTAYNTAYTFTPPMSDPDGDPLTIIAAGSGVAHGSVSFTASAITYTPTTGYSGADNFGYTIRDPSGLTASGTVSVTVKPQPPVANATSKTVNQNSSNNALPLSITGGTATSVSVTSGPAHGSASVSGLNIYYTPTAGYTGSDTVYYNASNAGGTSAAAPISITVQSTCTAPTANNVSRTVAYNSSSNSITPSVTGSYSSVSVVSSPAHGTASASGTTLFYTPTSGYYGSDSFTYRATGCAASNTATVSITVSAPAAPTVGNGSLTVNYNSAGSVALTPSGTWTSLAIATPPAKGSASISGTTATYTPNSGATGSDSFTYTATGPGGTSAPGTISVTINPAPSVSASVSSTSYYREVWGAQFQPATPSNVTITASGGVAPYSYSWEYVSGDTGMTVENPSSATTGWRHTTPMTNYVTYTAVWRGKVTDNTGNVAYTPGVGISIEKLGAGGN